MKSIGYYKQFIDKTIYIQDLSGGPYFECLVDDVYEDEDDTLSILHIMIKIFILPVEGYQQFLILELEPYVKANKILYTKEEYITYLLGEC